MGGLQAHAGLVQPRAAGPSRGLWMHLHLRLGESVSRGENRETLCLQDIFSIKMSVQMRSDEGGGGAGNRVLFVLPLCLLLFLQGQACQVGRPERTPLDVSTLDYHLFSRCRGAAFFLWWYF